MRNININKSFPFALIATMNITIVNKHKDDLIGGSEVQCDLIASVLVKRGHTVNYVAPGGNQSEYKVPYTVLKCEMEAGDILDKIIESNPDVIYWRFNKNFFYRVAKEVDKRDIPFIFAASHISDLNPWFYKKKSGIRGRITYLIKSYWNHRGFAYVDALTVNNKEFLGTLNFSPQHHIPNGMIRDFEPFEWNKPYCAWISSIKQVKRPEKMIQLAENFSNKEVDFIMVGKVQEKSYNWFLKKKFSSNLHYLGEKSLEEVNGILRSAQVHIHTCYPEGFPNVFIQAWLQGTPSVSLGFDPNGLIKEHQMGFCANDDWNIFKEKIAYLLNNPQKRVEMGENAQLFASDIFSTEKTVDKIEEVIQSII